jgi:hypothetical protein
MSFLAEFFKSLNIGGPTYFDKIDEDKPLTPANQKLKPPTTGLLGALGVGQVERKIGPLTFRAVNMNPTTDEEKKRFDLFQKNQASNERERKRRDEQARQSLVKEAADAAETPEEKTAVPTPPTPPETGQISSKPTEKGSINNEESASSTESDVKGGTVNTDKTLTASAIKPKNKLKGSLVSQAAGLLTEEEKKKLGLLS